MSYGNEPGTPRAGTQGGDVTGAARPSPEDRVVDLGDVATLLAEERRVVTVEGEEVLLLRLRRGVAAVPNRCPHMGFPLADAAVSGTRITCPFHRCRFDLRTGKPAPGAFGRGRRCPPMRRYRAWVAGGRVFLALPTRP